MVLEFDVISLFLLAFVIGGMIGLERGIENKKHIKTMDSFWEIRTFSLISFFGAFVGYLSITLDNMTVLMMGLGIFSLFVLIYYFYGVFQKEQIGMTTEITGIITFLLWASVMLGHGYLALVLSILITFLLSSKQLIAEFDQHISREELSNTIKFAIISLVILPLLPTEKFSLQDILAWGGVHIDFQSWDYYIAITTDKILEFKYIFIVDFLSLYKIWFFVVLMSGISYVGYILSKFIGSKGSILASGAVGGLVSSTAVTASMTENSKRDTKNRDMYVVSTLLASTIMFIRVIVIVLLFNQNLLGKIFFPAFFMFVFMGGYIYFFYKRAQALWESEVGKSSTSVTIEVTKGKKWKKKDPEKFESPFQIMPALKFAGFVLIIKFISAVWAKYQEQLGEWLFYFLGLISGLADVDAISQTMAEDSKNGLLPGSIAVFTIIIAIISNNFVKWGFALKLGEKKFGISVFLGFVVSMIGGILGMALSYMYM